MRQSKAPEFPGLLRRLWMALRASPENPTTNLSDPDQWLIDWFGGGTAATGIAVTRESAMRCLAFFACVRVLGESVASLPCMVYRRRADGRGKDRADGHPIYELLHVQPNGVQSGFSFFETETMRIASGGNSYSLIELTGGGQVAGLWPRDPDTITPVLDKQRRAVVYLENGFDGPAYAADRVLHVPGPGTDGVKGLSPVSVAREALGLALAAEKYGATLFGRGGRPAGVLSSEAELEEEQAEELRKRWEQIYGSIEKSNRVVVLGHGAQFKPITIPPEDAQFLESRRFQAVEIARMFRMPPHMIGDLERATFSNIEHQSLAFVVHTLRPWLVRWEREINRKLFTPREREQGYFAEFKVEGLLRGASAARAAYYASAITNGWMNRNEARGFENMNAVDGLDEFLVPKNMGPGGKQKDE